MPNWVTNYVYITGSAGAICRLIRHMSTEDAEGAPSNRFDFNQLARMPDELKNSSSPPKFEGTPEEQDAQRAARLKKYGAVDWYGWAQDNWGTKWNACNLSEWEVVKLYPGSCLASIRFDTAWTCPYPIFSALVDRYPELYLEVKWFEEDHQAGIIRTDDGLLTREDGTWEGFPHTRSMWFDLVAREHFEERAYEDDQFSWDEADVEELSLELLSAWEVENT